MGTRALAASTGWDGWSWYWLIWFVITFPVAFLVPEIYNIASGRPQDTLSAQIWRLEQFLPRQAGPIWSWTAMHFLIGGVLAVLLIWLIGHFVAGVWT